MAHAKHIADVIIDYGALSRPVDDVQTMLGKKLGMLSCPHHGLSVSSFDVLAIDRGVHVRITSCCAPSGARALKIVRDVIRLEDSNVVPNVAYPSMTCRCCD